MGWRDWFRRRSSEPKPPATFSLPGDMDFISLGPGASIIRPRASPPSPSHDLFAAAVDLIAHTISAVPVSVRDSGGSPLPADHPVVALFHNTAPERSISELIREVVRDYYYHGHAVVVIEERRLIRIPAAYAQLEVSRRDGAVRYQEPFSAILVAGRRIPYDRIIHIRRSKSGIPWEIQSIASDLERERLAYQRIITYLDQYVQNGGLTPFLLITDFPRSEEQMRQMREMWKEVVRPQLNMDIPPVLDRVRVERLGNSIRDMGLLEAIQILEVRICQALGVPPTLLNTYIGMTNASYANMRTAMVQFRQFTLLPMLRMLEEAFQAAIARKWPEARVTFETRLLEAMMGDREETARLFERGIITRREARVEIGYPPVPESGEEAEPPPNPRRRGGRPRSTDPTAPAREFAPEEYDREIRQMALRLAREEKAMLEQGIPLEEVVDRTAGRWADLMRRLRPDLPVGAGRTFAWRARANQKTSRRAQDMIQFALNGEWQSLLPLVEGRNGSNGSH